jgi:polar amino acid transport system permease protein
MSTSQPTTTVGIGGKDLKSSKLADLEIRPRVGVAYWLSIVLAIYLCFVLIEFFVFNENWNWSLVFSYLFSKTIMNGLTNTILLTLLTTLLGLALGVVTAWCRMSHLVVLSNYCSALHLGHESNAASSDAVVRVLLRSARTNTGDLGIPFGPQPVRSSDQRSHLEV